MGRQPYLVFRLKDEFFAIAASMIREMFQVPELTSVENPSNRRSADAKNHLTP